LFALRTSLDKYSWSAEGSERLSLLGVVLTQYQEKRRAFLESSDRAALALSQINTMDLASLAEKLASSQASLPAGIAAPLLSLSFKTEQAAFYIQAFIKKPESVALDKFTGIRDTISP
ncbi:hypothetical protein ACQJ2X_29840, partial [Bacillus wiedmannii]